MSSFFERKRLALTRARLGVLAVLALCAGQAWSQTVVKLGTLAPEGSVWHDALLEIRDDWRRISDGEVELRIYAGGVLGDEDEMIRKMQRRGLDALAVSGSGLPLIDEIVQCLQLPLLFDSYAELELVRDSIAAELEQGFERAGYKVLNWAEAGWVHFFGKAPVRTPDDLRELRLWIGMGSPETERMIEELGFRGVPLPVTDMLTGLQTGLIEVIDVPPLFALLDRSFQAAPFMTDLRFAPLNAATVMTMPMWERIPEDLRDPFLASARAAAARMREQIHVAETEAIEEMVARGLTIVSLEQAEIEAWRNEARAVYPQLACATEHPELYREVLQLQPAR
jgi:TRAP-type C4-dicarboxylate transport system substrate-binding protein